jgi:outer membrane protein assembly factor BamB
MSNIYTLSCLLLFSLLMQSCTQKERIEGQQKNILTASWPIFRGDARLSGVSGEVISDSLKLLWTFQTEDEIKSSPVIGNNLVYIGSTDGKVYSINLIDGQQKWVFDTGNTIEAPPLLVDSTIFIGSLSGMFYALDANSGQLNWQFETDGQILGSANWITPQTGKNKWILVGNYDNFLYCFDSDNGKLKWKYETSNYINGAPATDNKNVIFGGCDELVHIVSGQDGSKVGEVLAGSYIAGSAAFISNHAYLGHYGEKLICIDLEQKKIVWEYGDEKDSGAFFSSPAVSDNYVIIGSRDRYLHCINRENGKRIWRFRTRDDIDSSPVICKNKVVVGSSDGRLYVVDISDGSEIWSYEIGAPVNTSPAIAGGKIVIGAEDGRIYAFGKKL